MVRIQEHTKGWSKTPALFLSLAAVTIVVGLCIYMSIATKEASADAEESPTPIVLSSSLLDFGLVPLNGSAVRQLILRNDGTDPMTAALSVSGSNYKVKPDRLLLHPGIAARVSVSVRPERPGSLDDELRIAFEEQEGEPLIVALEGRAHADAAGEGLRPGPSSVNPRATELAGNTEPGSEPLADKTAADKARVPGGLVSTGGRPDFSGVISQSGRPGGSQSASEPTAIRTSRSPAQAGDQGGEQAAQLPPAHRGSIGLTVLPANPHADENVPFDDQRRVSETIGKEEAKRAHKLRSKIDDEAERQRELPDREEIEEDPDGGARPIASPTLSISGVSNARLIGSSNTFYPQRIQVDGSPSGGPISLRQPIQFPRIAWAMGESMDFKQVGAVAGTFDPQTGRVDLNVPLAAVDLDNRAAPLPLLLTTDTVMARDETGLLVSFTGTARNPSSGILKLVGVQKIPVGYGNSAEQQLAVFEILASLDFDTAPSGLGR